MLSPCSVFGCLEVGTVRGRCPRHAREGERTRGSAWRRGYDTEWQALRLRVLSRQPRCPCGAPAVDVHHVWPRRRGGPDALCNLVALCKVCHSRLTKAGA